MRSIINAWGPRSVSGLRSTKNQTENAQASKPLTSSAPGSHKFRDGSAR